MSKPEQQAIAKYFSKKPLLYIGGLGQVFGVNAGLLLSQLLYWHGKGKDKSGWIYKTAADIEAETGLTRSNQETAIKKLVKLDVIDYKLAQVPAKRHFRVKLEELHNILPSLKESRKLDYPNPPNYYVPNGETITKITRETTTKNTVAAVNKNNFQQHRQRLIASKSVRGP
ncbi:MAG TPA: hypothetical protein VK694_00420 [Verrucomicrobiae bacterium]|nr:hypothetical protein [Verrucomicrobiae bacterium]